MKCIYEESVIYLALEQMTAEDLLPKTHNGQIKNCEVSHDLISWWYTDGSLANKLLLSTNINH